VIGEDGIGSDGEGTLAFFAKSANGFISSELTRGPWDAGSQHAGPPSALIGRAIERCDGLGSSPADRLVARVTFEILKPVPIAELRLEAEVVRGGRRVDMVEATLSDAAGEPLVRARGWRVLRRDVDLPDGLGGADAGSPALRAGRPAGELGPPPGPETVAATDTFFPTGYDVGYHTAMEYRFTAGAFLETGPATCWLRMRHPLVEGEEPSPLQRVLIAADSGNGISSTLDFRRYLFINVDLTVHLHRLPAGEWVCLDSVTVPERTGLGMTDTMIFDESGPLGRAAQSLLIAER
jgi:hypothetical protein